MSSISRFKYLTISRLDLSMQHPRIHRTVASSFITQLKLHSCATQSIPQLGRFITSFPSLKRLYFISWSLSQQNLKNTRICRSTSKSSIDYLHLHLASNVSGLLDYFVKAKPFVAHLKELLIRWEVTEDGERNTSFLLGLNQLFQHTSHSLESLKIYMDNDECRNVPDHLVNLSEWRRGPLSPQLLYIDPVQ